MSKTIGHAGIVVGFRALKDGTLSFTINCQEMNPEQAGKIVALNNQYVKFLLTDQNVIPNEMEEELKNLTLESHGKKKSPAQRLRNSIYILHQQSDTDMDFDAFYDMWMDKIIQTIKNKLD